MRIALASSTRVLAFIAVLAVPALAAPQESDVQPPEIQRMTGGLQGLVTRIDALQVRARTALEQARQAKTQEECEALTSAAVAVGDEIRELLASFEKEVVVLRIATSPTKVQIMDALKLRKLEDGRDVLKKIKADLSKDGPEAGEDTKRLLGLVKYQLADVLRKIAVRELRSSRNDQYAATVLQQAINEYELVLDCPDTAVAEVGSSLHAAALRRSIQCEAALYEGYKRLLKLQPTAMIEKKMKEHREAAEEAFDYLQRSFSDDTVEDGRVIDVARQDYNRLRQQ